MANTNKEAAKTKGKKVSKKTNSETLATTQTVNVSAASSQVPSSSAALISETEQRRLQEMLILANLEYNKIKSKVVREKRREIDSLDTQIKEFLGPYILIGYDLNNCPVEIVSAGSPAENDALLERFRRVMFKINQNITNSDGNDPFGNGG